LRERHNAVRGYLIRPRVATGQFEFKNPDLKHSYPGVANDGIFVQFYEVIIRLHAILR